MSEHFKPVPDDPDAPTVETMFDAKSPDWILTATGDYETAAAQAMSDDGSNMQNVVILQWPGRRNHTTEFLTVRLMMSPEDAVGLGEVLLHTGLWMRAKGLGSESSEIEPFDPMCGVFAKDMTYMDALLEEGQSRAEYVAMNEGTYNRENGHFLCDTCYIKAGMPSSPEGWKCP